MKKENSLVYILSACSFVVFFQTYLFAPILSTLAQEFHASDAQAGWIVPAFMLPYGLSALLYGTIADRLSRIHIVLFLLVFMCLTIVAAAFTRTIEELLVLRALSGFASGGIIPISIALVGDVFAYKDRGRPLGWIYSGMAGGAALGSTLGAYLNPSIGWRNEMIAIGVVTFLISALLHPHRKNVPDFRNLEATFVRTFHAYAHLLRLPRGGRTYFFILLNSAFHLGVFTWLGWYFAHRYGLGDRGVGLALLGYGVPGMLLGPIIGRWADRVGRRKVLPLDFAISALAAFLLVPNTPLWVSALVSAILSLGYDLTQPLLGGLVTSIDQTRRGQAISLSAFCLFIGFGVGPLIFELFMNADAAHALWIFAVVETLLALGGVWVFKSESASQAKALS